MYGVVNEGGTGAAARSKAWSFPARPAARSGSRTICAKSGMLDADEAKDNGWFVGFAPRENPEIVVAVLLEGGEHGAWPRPSPAT